MPFSIATFNTRDLFDDEPPNVIGDLDRFEYTEDRRAKARRLLDAKLNSVAATLTRLDADIVCLQEVKGERVLAMLAGRLEGRVAPYPTRLVGVGRDPRGIHTAVLSRFPLAGPARYHNETEDPAGFSLPRLAQTDPEMPVLHFKRGLLEVELELPGAQRLTLFNLHLKSNYPMVFSQPASHGDVAEGLIRASMLRLAEALAVRRIVDARLTEDPSRLLAVVGDFNEGPDALVVRTIAGDRVEGLRRGLTGTLLSVTSGLPPDCRFTNLWRGRRELLDHCLVSASLFARFVSSRIHNEILIDLEASLGRSSDCAESDHAPILASFR